LLRGEKLRAGIYETVALGGETKEGETMTIMPTSGTRSAIPDNEFSEIGYHFVDANDMVVESMHTADEAYHCELAFYNFLWCDCGAYILVSKTDPKPLYRCRCRRLIHNTQETN